MRFYIGSGMKHHALVDAYAQRLKENGWEQTYCWTKCIGEDVTLDTLAEYAEKEQQGIADADVVIILLPAGRGRACGIGYGPGPAEKGVPLRGGGRGVQPGQHGELLSAAWDYQACRGL